MVPGEGRTGNLKKDHWVKTGGTILKTNERPKKKKSKRNRKGKADRKSRQKTRPSTRTGLNILPEGKNGQKPNYATTAWRLAGRSRENPHYHSTT